MKPLRILFIDDDTIEFMKLQRTIASLELNHKLMVAINGEQALQILDKKENIIDIILLDLNMPKINGIDFLSILKSSATLNHIPVIILTTSSNEKDLLKCYKLGIAGYILKPLKYNDYVNKIDQILSYWSINQLIRN